MAGDIVLTADSTLMSTYRNNEFLGFGTCAPSNFIPDSVYRWLFFPPIKTEKGRPVAAPYGLRKVEAQLLLEGFNVTVAAPGQLELYLEEAKVLGIHVMDPFGLGPASSTLAAVLRKEPFLARHFRELLSRPEIRQAKRRGLKIIVGGPGAWQFSYRPAFVERFGIDCVIEGEAEKVVGRVFKAALEGGELPKRYAATPKEAPGLDEIPDISGPSINGLVEIGRGCCRGCAFCSVTLKPLRWHSLEKICREINVNMRGGVKQVCLHAEDVMLYGSNNTLPDDAKLVALNEAAMKRAEGLSWSHCSLAAVASKPKLFSKVSEIVRQKQDWWGAEIGIETGSSELAKRIMPAKAHPFKVEKWPEVVVTGMGLMHDNWLVPVGTLIVGSPDESESDVVNTLELMDDLKGFRSLIVPLFFVPMGRLKDDDWFKDTQMTRLHQELLAKCLRHDLHWVDKLIDLSIGKGRQALLTKPFFKLFASLLKLHIARSKIGLNQ